MNVNWRVVVMKGVPRTSSLLAPIVLLEGHQAEIYSCKFDPSGKALASAGFDKRICTWHPNDVNL